MCKAKKSPYESNDIKTIYIIPKEKEIKVTYGTEMELKFCGDNMIYMKETVSLAQALCHVVDEDKPRFIEWAFNPERKTGESITVHCE